MKGGDKTRLSEENSQVNNILEAVMSLAALEFDHKAEIRGESEQLDALASAINMLGEELKSKVMLLHERETVLREIHHRVKNNLQVVSSILNLQASVIKDPEMAQKFRDCQTRIQSMALVHSQLYSAHKMDELEINAYFSELCHRLHEIYERMGIGLHFCGLDHAFYLETDRLLPLGLLVSELLINSFVHGFGPDDTGSIRLEVVRSEEGFALVVSDTGKGFSDPDLFYDSQSLGLQLVHSLAEQLEAQLLFRASNPYEVRIFFK